MQEQVLKRAKELYVQNCYRSGTPELADVEPEPSELIEGGFVNSAISELHYSEQRKNAQWLKTVDPLETQLSIPFDIEEALRSGFYITGTTGSGKSDIAMYLVDRLMQHGIIVFVFDSTQDWLNRSSVPYYTTVQRNIPFDIVLDRYSTIYDIHALNATERQKLVEAFSSILYNHQASKLPSERRQCVLIFEEAQTYLWQNSLRSKKAQNTAILLTEGRNYSVRFGCITQFSSMLDKNAMRYMKQRYFGFTSEPNDTRYLHGFLDASVEELKTLQAGEFVYSDSSGKLTKVQIKPYETANKPMKLETQQQNTTQPQQDLTLGYLIIASAFIGLLGWVLLLLR